MGFHFYGTISAIVFPTFLTATCYLGTWVLMLLDGSWTEIFSLREWKISFQEWTWWRHIIVGPISEELAFRSCTAVLINYCFGWSSSLFISPLFFSLCHFHHIHNDLKEGATLSNAILQRAFQATYSYLFGVYATYLFLRTGHIFAPIFSHSLCNGLGLPNIAEIGTYQKETRIKLWISYFVGLFLWILLLDPLTTPILYQFL
uniref:CAAX prenyl protease 2 n=1 Tax=Acrobeloides nanus TaxID=290746 RepID=A0A914DPR1_9BILA